MKRTEPVRIGEVLRKTIAAQGLTDGLARAAAIQAWRPLVGKSIAARCGTPAFRGDTLTVSCPSPALRQELTMHRSRLAEAINRHIGRNVVADIRFTS